MSKFHLDDFALSDAPKKKKTDTQAQPKMMNIRFSQENYSYVRKEAALRGLSVIAFVNYIVDLYRSDPAHVHENPFYRNEESW